MRKVSAKRNPWSGQPKRFAAAFSIRLAANFRLDNGKRFGLIWYPSLMENRFAFALIALILFAASVCHAGQARGPGRGPGGAQRPANEVEISPRALKQDLPALELQAQNAERAAKWPEATIAYLRASILARQMGELEKALAHGEHARRLSERAKVPAPQVMAILQLALTHKLARQEEQAGELLKKGAELVKQIADPRRRQMLEANVWRELGFYYLNQGETQKGIDYLSSAVKLHEAGLAALQRQSGAKAGARPQVIRNVEQTLLGTLVRLGAAQRDAGQFAEAEKSFARGIELMQRSGQQSSAMGKFFQEFGELYLVQKDYSRAMEFFDRVLRDSNLAPGEFHAIKAGSQMGFAFLEMGKTQEAIGQFKRAIDSIESIRAALDSESLRTTFFENKRRVYAGMITAHVAAGQIAEAFNYNERARSRAFLDILGSQVELARDHGLLTEERALHTRLRALEAKLAPGVYEEDGDEAPADEEEIKQELAEAQKAYDGFVAKVRKSNQEQASLMSVEPLNLKQVQQALDPGVTLLEYFLAGDQILLWIIDKERASLVRISQRRRDLIAKLRSLRQKISEPTGQSAGLKENSQELYRLLIEPALAHVRGKELLIVPHDVLHYLPFQALVSPRGRYLIEDYAIHYLSSASLMRFTKEKKRAGRDSALALGNPSRGDEAYNLRFAEREAKEIAAVYPKSSILLREQATKAKAIALSPDNDILHFAVHAEFNQEDPTSSALLLAREGSEDGKWKVSEIFSLNLKADLVVLSACETGLGKISNGDEIIGLTRAFIYAGTPSVITTLWKVNDRASFELMKEFYLQLKTQKKSVALRQAQLKTMKEFPEPFFWAAFGLTGEP
jgi:CHAT domain-containing protein